MATSVNAGQYVYVICSAGSDYFAEIAAISIATLRIVEPTSRIVVLTDRPTSQLRSAAISIIRNAADFFKIVDCPGDSAIYRSRYLKTSVRELVAGRCVYLDSDTIVMKSPACIWKLDCDVAACPDLAPNGKSYCSSNALPEECGKLKMDPWLWTLPERWVFFLFRSSGAIDFAQQYREFLA